MQAFEAEQRLRERRHLRGRIEQSRADLKNLARLENDARRALANLEQREAEYADHVKQHSGLAKDIASREAQIIQIEAEMAPIRRRILESQRTREIS
jgi:hypothetical protein